MDYPIQLINILDIYLDSKNPRHDILNDQQEIIKHLVSDEKVQVLAKDISLLGTSPLDLVAVMKNNKGHYIVLEGNRRICSLKLLIDPDQAPNGKISIFKTIQKNSTYIPNEVMAVIFDSREKAEPWLDRRHMGLQGGIGIKDWDSDQRTRRNSSKKNNPKDNNALAQSLLNYAQKYNLLINNKYPKKVLTTASRYLGNPNLREGVGIVSARTNPVVEINVSHEDFDCFLKQFCIDLLKGHKVHSRSKKADWLKYLEELQNLGYASSNHVSKRRLSERQSFIAKYNDTSDNSHSSKNIQSSSSDIQNNQSLGVKGNRSTKNPDNRYYIIPSDFKIKITNKILRRTLDEMCRIKVVDNPLAVALITRAFLEATYFLFVEAVTGKYPTGKNGIQTHKVIEIVHDILKDENTSFTKAQRNAHGYMLKLASNQHSPLSPQTLGSFAHAAAYPDHKALKREFDNIAPIIEYILPRI